MPSLLAVLSFTATREAPVSTMKVRRWPPTEPSVRHWPPLLRGISAMCNSAGAAFLSLTTLAVATTAVGCSEDCAEAAGNTRSAIWKPEVTRKASRAAVLIRVGIVVFLFVVSFDASNVQATALFRRHGCNARRVPEAEHQESPNVYSESG